MKRKKKYFILPVLLFLLVYFLVHLKNYFQVGYFYTVIKDDIFDKFFYYLEMPGSIPGFLLVILIYQNVHNYNDCVAEILITVFNCLFYGFIFWFFGPLIISFLRRESERLKGL
jgi:hypothetical protein